MCRLLRNTGQPAILYALQAGRQSAVAKSAIENRQSCLPCLTIAYCLLPIAYCSISPIFAE
jgi:hypothetical protein